MVFYYQWKELINSVFTQHFLGKELWCRMSLCKQNCLWYHWAWSSFFFFSYILSCTLVSKTLSCSLILGYSMWPQACDLWLRFILPSLHSFIKWAVPVPISSWSDNTPCPNNEFMRVPVMENTLDMEIWGGLNTSLEFLMRRQIDWRINSLSLKCAFCSLEAQICTLSKESQVHCQYWEGSLMPDVVAHL